MILSPAFEYFAYENNSILKKINPVTKTILFTVYLFLNVWLLDLKFLIVFLFSILLFLIAKIDLRLVKRAIISAFVISILIFFTKVFLWKYEKFSSLISSLKIISGLLFVLSYIGTTPLNEVLGSLKKLKVPHIFIETFLLIYKNIFVINDDGIRLRNAQMVRLGYNDFSNSLRSFGTLWGALFVRSVSRAEKVVSALTVRGYRGSFYYPTTLERLKLEDLILIFFAGFLPLVSFIFGLV